jgi:hypothetical protein
VTLADLRKLVPEKAKSGHKDSILAEFKKYGVPNIAALDKGDYEAFYFFLETL